MEDNIDSKKVNYIVKNIQQNKKKNNKKTKSSSAKSKIAIFLLILTIGVTTGYFAGNWYSNNFGVYIKVDYSIYNESTLKGSDLDSAKELWSQSKTPLDYAKDDEKTIFLFLLAENNFVNHEKFKMENFGSVNTILQQYVYSYKVCDGNTFYYESSSCGAEQISEQVYYDVKKYNNARDDENVINLMSADKNSISRNSNGVITAVYNNYIKGPYSKTNYKKSYGDLPCVSNPYLVSTKTATVTSKISKKIYKEKQVYTFSLSLDPQSSVINYVKQMMSVSGFQDPPVFSSINLDVAIDDNYDFVYINISEAYKVKYGPISPSCNGYLNSNFYFDEDLCIVPYSKILGVA